LLITLADTRMKSNLAPFGPKSCTTDGGKSCAMYFKLRSNSGLKLGFKVLWNFLVVYLKSTRELVFRP